MFGYIRTDTPELRVRENEYYKAVYCGMCRAQGKCTGQCSRLTLSYDMVFLALLRLAVSGENPTLGFTDFNFSKHFKTLLPLNN